MSAQVGTHVAVPTMYLNVDAILPTSEEVESLGYLSFQTKPPPFQESVLITRLQNEGLVRSFFIPPVETRPLASRECKRYEAQTALGTRKRSMEWWGPSSPPPAKRE